MSTLWQVSYFGERSPDLQVSHRLLTKPLGKVSHFQHLQTAMATIAAKFLKFGRTHAFRRSYVACKFHPILPHEFWRLLAQMPLDIFVCNQKCLSHIGGLLCPIFHPFLSISQRQIRVQTEYVVDAHPQVSLAQTDLENMQTQHLKSCQQKYTAIETSSLISKFLNFLRCFSDLRCHKI